MHRIAFRKVSFPPYIQKTARASRVRDAFARRATPAGLDLPSRPDYNCVSRNMRSAILADAFFIGHRFVRGRSMNVTSSPISKQGYKKLEDELARLKSERPAIIQAIKEAREEGDLRENAGYDAARERQGMAEARIKYIESRMALYQVVDLDKLSGDKVVFGATVEVEDVDTEESRTFTILGPDEADPARGSISFLSPVGQALLGKEEGDEVSVDIPRGRVTYEIVSISFNGSKVLG